MKSKAKIKIILVALLILLGGGYLFFREGALPVNRANNAPKIFVIRPGDGLNAITNNLKEQNLIRNRVVFFSCSQSARTR